MNISRLYSGPDGQTHVEWMDLEAHPELATLQKGSWHPVPVDRGGSFHGLAPGSEAAIRDHHLR